MCLSGCRVGWFETKKPPKRLETKVGSGFLLRKANGAYVHTILRLANATTNQPNIGDTNFLSTYSSCEKEGKEAQGY